MNTVKTIAINLTIFAAGFFHTEIAQFLIGIWNKF